MNSQTTVRLVIGILGLLALVVIAGAIVLTLDDKSLPGELIAMGSVSVGGIAGILSRTGDTDVRVVNDPEDPVPVDGQP